MTVWNAFFEAQAGASAALLGLVFVGFSINARAIIGSTHLPNRALEALSVLLLNLTIASLALVPGQSARDLALCALIFAGAVWLGVSVLHVQNLRRIDRRHRSRSMAAAAIGQLAGLAWLLGAAAVLTRGVATISWLVPGFLLGYLLASLNAWVLLVEVNR